MKILFTFVQLFCAYRQTYGMLSISTALYTKVSKKANVSLYIKYKFYTTFTHRMYLVSNITFIKME